MSVHHVLQNLDVDRMPEPPLIKGLPLIGSLIPFLRDPFDFFIKQYRQKGPIFDIRVLNKQYTVVAGPEANLFLAQKETEYLTAKTFFHDFCQEFGSESFLFYQEGETHRLLRGIMRPGLSYKVINRYCSSCVALTKEIASMWQPGQRIPLVKFMQQLIGQSSGILLANYPLGDYLPDLVLFLNTMTSVTLVRRWPRLALYRPSFLRAKKRVMEFLCKVVASHRNRAVTEENRDYVDNILKAADEGDPLFASEIGILSAILIPYIGGLDAVAYTLAFMLYALLKHPNLLEQARAEVDDAFARGIPDSQTLRNMPTLHATAMETLRMYPVAPFVMRSAIRPFTFADHHIKQGQEIIFAITLPHFFPEFFPDPYTFDITRYSDPRNEHRQKGVLAPFGQGMHTCIGAGLGEAQIMLTMATLLHTMDMVLDPPDYEVKPRIDALLSPGHDLYARFIRWRSL